MKILPPPLLWLQKLVLFDRIGFKLYADTLYLLVLIFQQLTNKCTYD